MARGHAQQADSKILREWFPHGVDQFLSMQATCWAIIALAQPLPVVAASEQPALPWLNAPAVATNESIVINEPTAEQLDFFEREIRPLLVENCISCHGPDDQSGDLRVDSLAVCSRAASRGRPSFAMKSIVASSSKRCAVKTN